MLLTKDGKVYSCGINEKGTVPAKGVEPEGSTDEFTEIEFTTEISALGKVSKFFYIQYYSVFLDYHACRWCQFHGRSD